MPRPPGPNSTFKPVRARPGTARIAGIEIPIEEGLQLVTIERKPGELFPKRSLKAFKPLSATETARVNAYRRIRDAFRESNSFSVLPQDGGGNGERVGNGIGDRRGRRSGSKANGIAEIIVTDPFDNGVQTYSKKYVPKKRALPVFESDMYDLNFFPRELWSTVDPTYASVAKDSLKRKRLAVATAKKSRLDIVAEKAAADERNALARAGKTSGADPSAADGASDIEGFSDEDNEGEGGERNAAGEDIDDEFEEDEDDLAGDYNAEQYFDDGGDDAGDDYEGGDGGGGDDGMY